MKKTTPPGVIVSVLYLSLCHPKLAQHGPPSTPLDAEDPECQAVFMADVPVFTCPDARRACGFIPFRDTTGDILSSVMADHPLVTSQLCIPDVEQEPTDDGPQFAPDSACTTPPSITTVIYRVG